MGIFISLYTGLRIGEVCGLKWSDIDFEGKLIYVRRTVQRVYLEKGKKSKIIVTVPKTKKSLRKIPMAKKLIDKLKEFNNDFPEESYVLTGDEKNAQNLLFIGIHIKRF